jgi:hypothetical protein
MNKTDFATNGGFPIVLDDLIFEQEATRDAFFGLLSAFGIYTGALSCVISGCNFSSGVYQPGYVALNGEILKFDGCPNVILPSGCTLVWQVLSTFDSNGDKTLESTATFQAYEVRKAQITFVSNADSVNYLVVVGAPTLMDEIVELTSRDNPNLALKNTILAVIAAANLYAAKAQETPILIGSGGSAPAFDSGFAGLSAPEALRMWKDSIGNIHIEGSFASNSIQTGWHQIFPIPAGYRSNQVSLGYIGQNISTSAVMICLGINIYTSGPSNGLWIYSAQGSQVYSVGHIIFKQES